MKRFLAALLVGCLLLGPAAALGESAFALRNGVQFGDTMEEVKAKETLPIDAAHGDEFNLYTVAGDVADVLGASIWYRFDKTTGLLFDVRWDLPAHASAEDSDDDYRKLYDALVSQYGQPLGYSDGARYAVTGSALEAADTITELYRELFSGGVGQVLAYAEWDVAAGDGRHVKIEMAQLAYGVSPAEREYCIYLGYSAFTDEELAAALQAQPATEAP